MKVMFLVNGRWFKTLCKTVLEAEAFDVSISTEKHNIHASISDKCYFLSIDNYCLGYDTIDTIKTDFYFKRNYKNIKEFTAKLEDCFSSFINNSITDRHFHGNIDECINKILDDIKEAKRETAETETATAEATVEKKVWTVTQFPHVVRTFDKSGKMIYESFFETAEKAYEEYVDIIENEKENLPYGRELIVARFADGILMSRETIKGTCIYTNMRFVKKVTKDTAETETDTPSVHAKSLLNSAYGITSERETATDHTYEIRIFKDGVLSFSTEFSLESFAYNAFKMIETSVKVFPEPCFKVIELFKDGKLVKMSSIYFGKIALEVKNG